MVLVKDLSVEGISLTSWIEALSKAQEVLESDTACNARTGDSQLVFEAEGMHRYSQ